MHDNVTAIPARPQFPVAEISAAAQALIDLLNALGGDPDLEEGADAEHDGTDQGDQAWVEWTSMRGSQKPGPNIAGQHEDAEDDDVGEDDDPDSCPAREDLGSDALSGDDGQPGDPQDAESTHDDEIEQMIGDVPCIPVFALEPNIFTGERKFLGRNNLQPSFVSNGPPPRAFDADEPPEAA